MAEIRYVIISDVHFGATNSLLTAVRAEEADPSQPTPLLEGLLAGLAHLTSGQRRRPTLVLAGDVLDLALSPDEVAANAFERFVDLAFAPSAPVFDDVLYYLPGNHDHHLWETAREDQYLATVRSRPEEPLPRPWHVTRLLPERQPPAVTTELLATLIQRRPGGSDISVQVAYPNLALTTSDGRRCRVLSHGHFTESIYTLMSRLRDMVFPNQARPGPASVATLEEENFAWIDFFWSTLGRSGQVGADLAVVYADLTSSAALDVLAGNLIGAALAKGKGPAWLHPMEKTLVGAVFKREVNHLARSERGTPDVPLSAKTRQGLIDYLAGPVAVQLADELGGVPADMGFVWGHTHKPFAQRMTVPGYPAPVAVYNTGGWVVDTATPAPVQGGAVVLLDEELNAATLELYRQTADGSPAPVTVVGTGDTLGGELAGVIDPKAEPWSSISRCAAELVADRHRLQAEITALRQTRPLQTNQSQTQQQTNQRSSHA